MVGSGSSRRSRRATAAAALVFLLLGLVWEAQAEPFKCNSAPTPNRNVTCDALVGYVSPNATTLAGIQSLFNASSSFPSLLSANGFPPSTLPNQSVSAGQVVRIPFPCVCSNGTGVSNGVPVYVVVPDDGLFHIAAEVFAGLVTFQEIQTANNIPDVNLIIVGQRLWIPLPCSCDEVDGRRVIHYGHLVANGSTVEGIAQQFGTSPETLSRLNGLAAPTDLKAGAVIDVPLRACDSVIRNDSPDYPLLVPNGTYALTANGCVRCNCDAANNNWTLQCAPSQMKPSTSTWASCPSMECQGTANLVLGNTSTSSCNHTTCAYAGYYSNQTIITTTALESTCPGASGDNSWAVSIEGSWKQQLPIFIFVQLMLFSHVLVSCCDL